MIDNLQAANKTVQLCKKEVYNRRVSMTNYAIYNPWKCYFYHITWTIKRPLMDIQMKVLLNELIRPKSHCDNCYNLNINIRAFNSFNCPNTVANRSSPTGRFRPNIFSLPTFLWLIDFEDYYRLTTTEEAIVLRAPSSRRMI